jgi:CheY-like chemotaxis protein
MRKGPEVIIVDDDCCTLELYKLIVKTVLPDAEIRGFLSARAALEYLRNKDADDAAERDGVTDGASARNGQSLILCDLHMPIIDGFDFLDEFGLLPLSIRGRYAVYLLSADADAVESARHLKMSNLVGIFIKPLTGKKLVAILRQAGYAI